MDVFVLQAAHSPLPTSTRRRRATRCSRSAQKGHITGGKALGYTITQAEASVKRYEIIPEQAKLVGRTFQLAAERKGLLKIAKTLNAEAIPNPTGQHRAGKKASVWSDNVMAPAAEVEALNAMADEMSAEAASAPAPPQGVQSSAGVPPPRDRIFCA